MDWIFVVIPVYIEKDINDEYRLCYHFEKTCNMFL